MATPAAARQRVRVSTKSSGQKAGAKEYVEIIFRRKWLFLIPSVLVFLIALAAAFSLPKIYRANTLVFIQVPVVDNPLGGQSDPVNRVDMRLRTIKEEIQSYRFLSDIINRIPTLNLNVNSDAEREEFIRQMVKNIGVRRRGIELFEISYEDPNAQLTKQVANEITQKYIEDNQTRYSELYTSSLDALQLEQSRLLRQLKQKEAQMTKFQEENTEFLVSDVSIKTQIYNQQREIQRLANEVQAASKILLVLNNKLEDTPEMIESEKTVERDPKYEMVEKELTTLELSMDRLQLRYTEKHPEVKALQEQINMRKAQMEELEKKTKENVTEAVNPIYQRLMEQITEQEIEIQNLQGQLESARELLAELKLKEERVPLLDEENRNLTRDYEGLEVAYETISAKIRELETKEQMERRGQQIQFTIQDMARVPTRPISPNVPLIAGAGLVLGLGLGLGFAFGREYFDHSLRNVDQLRSALNVPVLGAVPVIVTEEELRQSSKEVRRKWLFVFLILFLLVAALAAVAIYWYWDVVSIQLGVL